MAEVGLEPGLELVKAELVSGGAVLWPQLGGCGGWAAPVHLCVTSLACPRPFPCAFVRWDVASCLASWPVRLADPPPLCLVLSWYFVAPFSHAIPMFVVLPRAFRVSHTLRRCVPIAGGEGGGGGGGGGGEAGAGGEWGAQVWSLWYKVFTLGSVRLWGR
jgi:hypothetical protein